MDELCTENDRSNAAAFVGKRFHDLPRDDQLAVWRLTDAKILMCHKGIVCRWTPTKFNRGRRKHG